MPQSPVCLPENPCGQETRPHHHLYFCTPDGQVHDYLFVSKPVLQTALGFAMTKGGDFTEEIASVSRLDLAEADIDGHDQRVFAQMLSQEGNDFDHALHSTGGVEGLF